MCEFFVVVRRETQNAQRKGKDECNKGENIAISSLNAIIALIFPYRIPCCHAKVIFHLASAVLFKVSQSAVYGIWLATITISIWLFLSLSLFISRFLDLSPILNTLSLSVSVSRCLYLYLFLHHLSLLYFSPSFSLSFHFSLPLSLSWFLSFSFSISLPVSLFVSISIYLLPLPFCLSHSVAI